MARPKVTIHDFKRTTFQNKCDREMAQLRQKLSQQLATDMQGLLASEIASDLDLLAGSYKIPVHLCILKHRAPWLYEDHLNNPGPGQTLCKNADSTTLKQVLRDIYSSDDLSSARGTVAAWTQGKTGAISQDTCSVSNSTDNSGEKAASCDLLQSSQGSVSMSKPPTNSDELGHDGLPTNGDELGQDRTHNAADILSPSSTDTLSPGDENCNWEVHQRTSNSTEMTVSCDPASTDCVEGCSELGTSLLQMYKDGNDTDMTIVVQGKQFKAHKCVLCARSSYFEAMLNSSWKESDSEEIELQGVSPGVLDQCLLYMYGGVPSTIPALLLPELTAAADMYSLAGLQLCVATILKIHHCHLFHKPCEGCLAGVCDTLQLTHRYGLLDLYKQCCKWAVKHMKQLWLTKHFAQLPPEILQDCSLSAKNEMGTVTVLDRLLGYDELISRLPKVKVMEPVSNMLTQLTQACIEYLSNNMAVVVSSEYFTQQGNKMALGLNFLEDVLCRAIRVLPPDKACDTYMAWKNKKEKADRAICTWMEDFCELVRNMCAKCLQHLGQHINQVYGTPGWKNLPSDVQKQIQEGAGFVDVGNGAPRQPPPKLSSASTQIRKRNAASQVTSRPGRNGNQIANKQTTQGKTPGSRSRAPRGGKSTGASSNKPNSGNGNKIQTAKASSLNTKPALGATKSPPVKSSQNGKNPAMKNEQCEGNEEDTCHQSDLTVAKLPFSKKEHDSISLCSNVSLYGSIDASESESDRMDLSESDGASRADRGTHKLFDWTRASSWGCSLESTAEYPVNTFYELTAPIRFAPDTLLPILAFSFMTPLSNDAVYGVQ